MLKLYNTLKRRKENFKPIKNKKVSLYTCGPTVYSYAHIGNLRTYIFEDILKRVLKYNGFEVKHVMNITDVGHLTSDSDTGEDKMEKGAKKEKKTVWEVADFYANVFKEDMKRLNIESPDFWTKATDYIKEQIGLIKVLEKKGFAYQISDGIYFDSSKIKDYGRLAGRKKIELKPGARVEVVAGKKNITDFALWKFSPPGIKRQMEWDSPWGTGFPGWHTECVVMSIKLLGIPFDIHCGGIDHIPIHHTNEIAQAEAAYGKKMANFWLHGEFLTLKDGRMGKSEGNSITVSDLIKEGFNPFAYRYLCLGANYRNKLTFSWEALKSSQNALDIIYQKITEIKNNSDKKLKSTAKIKNYKKRFLQFINNDLNTPRALALTWNLMKDKEIPNKEKYDLLLDFDRIFGLGLNKIQKSAVPEEIMSLVNERENYRKNNEWVKADEVRNKIKEKGWLVEDTKNGPVIRIFN